MALEYCEVCGTMLDGSTPSHPIGDAVICGQCFASRRTEVVSDEGPVLDEPLQFHCCYCQSLLRLKPVTKRTRVRCPTCNDTFYLHADGRVEAKLEGNRTAVLQQQTLPLQPPSAPDASKTQPIRRPDFPPQASDQEAMLQDLAPKRLDFLDDLPSSSGAAVDTGAFAKAIDQGSNLELLPEDVGPGDADDFQEQAPRLLQEGDIDLEPDELRRRVEEDDDEDEDEGPRAARRRGKRGRRSSGTRGRRSSGARSRPPSSSLSPEERRERQAERKERARQREKELHEREIKREAAEARGAIKAAEAERKVLANVAWFAVWLVPLALSLGAAAMAARGQGLASRGAVGDLLLQLGEAADTGVASVHDMLFPE